MLDTTSPEVVHAAGEPLTDGEVHSSSPQPDLRPGVASLERALPGIRARLAARHGDLGTAVVEGCLAAAVAASASFRVQEFRVILVERRADRELWHLRRRA